MIDAQIYVLGNPSPQCQSVHNRNTIAEMVSIFFFVFLHTTDTQFKDGESINVAGLLFKTTLGFVLQHSLDFPVTTVLQKYTSLALVTAYAQIQVHVHVRAVPSTFTILCNYSDSIYSIPRIHLLGYPLQSTSTGVDSFFSLILSYFCFFVAALSPCQGKLPKLKYINMYPSDSKSSRRLCSEVEVLTQRIYYSLEYNKILHLK